MKLETTNDLGNAQNMTREKVIYTLQYCLETFEQTCSCGKCDPCTQGQQDIRDAIAWMEENTD